MKAYSQDLREHVLHAIDEGYSQGEVAKLIGVSPATIKRYLKQRRETGNVQTRPIPGRPSKKFAPLRVGLVPQLEARPDATCQEHCQLWEQEHGMAVSPSSMGRAIKQVGWTRKKRQWEPQNGMKVREGRGENVSRSSMLAKL